MKKWMLMTTAIAATGLVAMSSARAEELNLWVRTSSAGVLEKLVDLYNASHDDKVVVTPITAEQMVPKLGTSIAAGAAPDGAVLDLIYLPTFAGDRQPRRYDRFHQGPALCGCPQPLPYSPSHL